MVGKYDKSNLQNVSINVKGLTNEIKEYISNFQEFELQFKEYIYLNGLVDAKTAVVKQWEVIENKLEILFEFDDMNITRIKAIINLSNNEIKIIEDNI